MKKTFQRYRNWKSVRRVKKSARLLEKAKRRRRAVEKWRQW